MGPYYTDSIYQTSTGDDALIGILALIVIGVICYYVIAHLLANPYRYPHVVYTFDVSHKRQPQILDYIDHLLCEPNVTERLNAQHLQVIAWAKQAEADVESSPDLLKKRRAEQLASVMDPQHEFVFVLTRGQTRYTQSHYVRHAYRTTVSDTEMGVSWQWLCDRYEKLAKTNYECSLREWHMKNQRKLMTPILRKQIMERDHYTCQRCGKYMPDEVGLHIDHIVPVARGGKTVPSNLQVLCSKCNGAKGAKTQPNPAQKGPAHVQTTLSR